MEKTKKKLKCIKQVSLFTPGLLSLTMLRKHQPNEPFPLKKSFNILHKIGVNRHSSHFSLSAFNGHNARPFRYTVEIFIIFIFMRNDCNLKRKKNELQESKRTTMCRQCVIVAFMIKKTSQAICFYPPLYFHCIPMLKEYNGNVYI